MLYKYNFYLIIIYSLFFVIFQLFSEGFMAGTLIKTATGYERIENLKIGEYVLCFDKDGTIVEQPIIYTAQKIVESYQTVAIGNEWIGC